MSIRYMAVSGETLVSDSGNLQIPNSLYASTYYGDGSNLTGIFMQDVTYSQLLDEITSSGLTVGSNYRITDYRTVNYLNGQVVADNMNSTATLTAGSLDPDFRSFAGFDGPVYALKQRELGSIYFSQSLGDSRVDVSCDSTFDSNYGEFTIEWFQYYTGDRGYNPRPFSVGSYPSAKIAISFESGPMNFFWWNSDGQPYGFTLDTPIENQWVHFAIVRDSGGTITIYQNGNSVYSALHNEYFNLDGLTLSIGNENSNTGGFDGYITNFRFTPNLNLYPSEFTTPTKPLVYEGSQNLFLQAMSEKRLLRNSCANPVVSISKTSVEWSKETPFPDERKIYVGGDFFMYEDNWSFKIARLNADGTFDPTFKTLGENYDDTTGFNNPVRCIEIQDDGKILVGGWFDYYNKKYCGRIVRLNEDGSQDVDFMTYYDGTGFDSDVEALYANPDGTIIVGGAFNNYQDDDGYWPVSKIAKLSTSGFANTTYTYPAYGFGPGGPVYTIRDADESALDSGLYLGGSFTGYTYQTTNTVPQNNLIRISNLSFDFDLGFFNNGGGFDKPVNDVFVQLDGKVLVVGGDPNTGAYTKYTNSGIDTLANGIIRLNSDATYDNSWITNYATGEFNWNVTSVYRHGNFVVVGGDFTTFDSTNVIPKLAVLDDQGGLAAFSGTYNPDSAVLRVIPDPDGNILCGGVFTSIQNSGGTLNYIAKYVLDSKDSGFSWSGTNVGPVEKLIVKAATEYSLDPIAVSEDYPQDIIHYSPYPYSLGRFFNIYGGVTLPDGNFLANFDLQWDEDLQKAYVQLPEGYPVIFGSYFELYLTFDDDNYEMYVYEPSPKPGLTSTPFTYNTGYEFNPYSRLTFTSDGYRVYLEDLTYSGYKSADPDGYMGVVMRAPVAETYGKIIRRIDTEKNVSAPFDFRNVKYRRYEAIFSNDVFNYGPAYVGLMDTDFPYMTGRYWDYPALGFRQSPYYNIQWEPSNAYGVVNDNNVFMGESYNIKIGGDFGFNTFMDYCINTEFETAEYNIVSNSEKNSIKYGFTGNKIIGGLYNNFFGVNFVGNKIQGYLTNNNIQDYFGYNRIYQSFNANYLSHNFYNNIIEDSFYYNHIAPDFSSNHLYQQWGYNRTTREFTGNVFSGGCNDSTFQLFQNNNVRDNFLTINLNSLVGSYDFGAPGNPNSAYVSQTGSKQIFMNTDGNNFISFFSAGTMVYLQL